MEWQKYWDERQLETQTGKHLREIKTKVGHWPWTSIPENRKLESMMSRLRIGHFGLRANRERFGMEISMHCDCGYLETVKHVLLECEIYINQRDLLKIKLN